MMSEENSDSYAHSQQLKADTTEEELIKLYSAWSKTYDQDLYNLAYIGPELAPDQLTKKLKEFGRTNDSRILDLGCGTGLAGEQLYKRGYHNIDGIDLSPELLEVARQKGVYKSLQEGRMMSEEYKGLGAAADEYDAVICTGVFTTGHVNSKGLDDIVHVVKPGGLASFTVKNSAMNDPEYGFHEKMNQLCEEGKWKLITKYYEPHYYKDGTAWFYIYQII